jgi:hypothetical protein
LEDLKVQSRARSLGNIRFIGELYQVQLMTPKIIIDIIDSLLGKENNFKICLKKLIDFDFTPYLQ